METIHGNITVVKTPTGYLLSTVKNGHLVQHMYLFYTKKEAIRLFKQVLKE